MGDLFDGFIPFALHGLIHVPFDVFRIDNSHHAIQSHTFRQIPCQIESRDDRRHICHSCISVTSLPPGLLSRRSTCRFDDDVIKLIASLILQHSIPVHRMGCIPVQLTSALRLSIRSSLMVQQRQPMEHLAYAAHDAYSSQHITIVQHHDGISLSFRIIVL